MEKVLYKGRERINRGYLTKFDDLPEYVRENFKLIKLLITEILGVPQEMYVFGSFKKGIWDNKSDYDIVITDEIDTFQLKNKLALKTTLKVDIFCNVVNNNPILIP